VLAFLDYIKLPKIDNLRITRGFSNIYRAECLFSLVVFDPGDEEFFCRFVQPEEMENSMFLILMVFSQGLLRTLELPSRHHNLINLKGELHLGMIPGLILHVTIFLWRKSSEY